MIISQMEKNWWLERAMCYEVGTVLRILHTQYILTREGFPGGAVVKNPPANAGDTGSSPGPGRSHMPQSN